MKKVSKKKVAKKATRKAGQPSKFHTMDLKKAEKLAKAGWTDKQMAEFFEVTEATWTNWKKKHAEFFVSLKDWKAIADHAVEQSLYKRATGYQLADKHYPPDTTACIFWLKNRNRKDWRDKHDHELTGKDGEALTQQVVVILPAKNAGD